MARNSTGFGLRQPHLERTRLCELGDADLDPSYVSQRSELREMLFSLAKPKVTCLEWNEAGITALSRLQQLHIKSAPEYA